MKVRTNYKRFSAKIKWRKKGWNKLFIPFLFLLFIKNKMKRQRHNPETSLMFLQDEYEKVTACVIPNTCLSLDISKNNENVPTIFLSDQFQMHSSYLLEHCFREPVPIQFFNTSFPDQTVLYAWENRLRFDVIGMPLSGQSNDKFPHILHSFLDYNIVPGSIFLEKRYHSLKCMKFATDTKDELDLEECLDSERFDLHPKLAVGSFIRRTRWNSGLIDIFSGGNGKNVHNFVDYSKQSQLQCFRSLLTSNTPFDTNNVLTDLLSKRGFSRDSHLQIKNGICRPKITILLRDYSNDGRTFTTQTLTNLRSKLKSQLKIDSTNAEIQYITNMNFLSVQSQFNLMKNTDVLVSIHGSELVNTLFMRNNTNVIEILPFGYSQENFDKIYEPLHLNVARISSAPDLFRFRICVQNEARLGNLDNPEKEQFLIDEFNMKAKLYEETFNSTEKERIASSFHSESAFCAGKQLISVDSAALAEVVSKKTRHYCEILKSEV